MIDKLKSRITTFNSWSKARRITAGILAVIVFSGIIVIASGLLGGHASYTVSPTAGYAYSIDLTGTQTAGEIIPGGNFSIDPQITNTSTGDVFMFVRINCKSITTDSGYKPIYTFTIANESKENWKVIEGVVPSTETEGSILVAYAADSMSPVEPGDSVELVGSLTLDVTNKEYKDIKGDLDVVIHGCAVHSAAEGEESETSGTPSEAYQAYLDLSLEETGN